MLALVAGFFLVSYLLAPGAIYRLAFSFFIPSKRFQRTRTEEVVFSTFAVIVPFLLAWLLLCHTPVGSFPAIQSPLSKNAAYREILNGLLAASPDKASHADAYLRVFREQGRFVAWLWLFCFGEGLLSGVAVNRYGDFAEGSTMRWFITHFLLNHVSEWQILFTTISLPARDRQKAVEVDVLSAGTLYRGRLVDWFVDNDGKLEGVFIADAARFQGKQWEADRVAGKSGLRQNYWRDIPGAKIYIAASSITNYNVRYVDTLESSEASVSNESGLDVTITLAEKQVPVK